MLDIKQLDNGDIALTGRFDASQREKVKAFIDERQDDIRLELSGMEYISSAGLGVLIGTHSRLDKAGKSLILLHPSKHVMTIFRLCHLDRVLKIVEESA